MSSIDITDLIGANKEEALIWYRENFKDFVDKKIDEELKRKIKEYEIQELKERLQEAEMNEEWEMAEVYRNALKQIE